MLHIYIFIFKVHFLKTTCQRGLLFKSNMLISAFALGCLPLHLIRFLLWSGLSLIVTVCFPFVMSCFLFPFFTSVSWIKVFLRVHLISFFWLFSYNSSFFFFFFKWLFIFSLSQSIFKWYFMLSVRELGFLGGRTFLPIQETWDMGFSLGWGTSPGGGLGNPSSIVAWRIPWTEGPGGL